MYLLLLQNIISSPLLPYKLPDLNPLRNLILQNSLTTHFQYILMKTS